MPIYEYRYHYIDIFCWSCLILSSVSGLFSLWVLVLQVVPWVDFLLWHRSQTLVGHSHNSVPPFPSLSCRANCRPKVMWLEWSYNPSTGNLAWLQGLTSSGSILPIARSHSCRFLRVSIVLGFYLTLKCLLSAFIYKRLLYIKYTKGDYWDI